MKKLRRSIYLIIILLIAAILYAPASWKTAVLGDSGKSGIIARIMPENAIIAEQITARKGLNGNWIINGWLINRNDFVVEECKLRFYFGNGIEHRSVNKVLNPGGAGKPFRIEITGHESSDYKRFEVYRAN